MSNATTIAQRLRSMAVSKPAIIGVVVLLIYTLAGFFAAPWLVRQQLPKLVEQHLGAKGSIENVRINPLLFSVELDSCFNSSIKLEASTTAAFPSVSE